MSKNLLAICLKTYPDEDDMRDYCDGKLEPCDVKIYYKGEKYKVTDCYDKKYFELIECNKFK
jgi:hypothetical protein